MTKPKKKIRSHRIFWIGEVDEEHLAQIISQILEIKQEYPKATIDLWVLTEGGSLSVAKAFIDFVRVHEINLITTGFGTVDSAGTMIFGAGKVRRATQNCTLHFHELYVERCEESLTAKKSKLITDGLKRAQNDSVKLKMKLYQVSRKLIMKLIRSDRDWTAKQMLEMKMIHEII